MLAYYSSTAYSAQKHIGRLFYLEEYRLPVVVHGYLEHTTIGVPLLVIGVVVPALLALPLNGLHSDDRAEVVVRLNHDAVLAPGQLGYPELRLEICRFCLYSRIIDNSLFLFLSPINTLEVVRYFFPTPNGWESISSTR